MMTFQLPGASLGSPAAVLISARDPSAESANEASIPLKAGNLLGGRKGRMALIDTQERQYGTCSKIPPRNRPPHQKAAAAIAAGQSTGTWTLGAGPGQSPCRLGDIDRGSEVEIGFPEELF